MISASQVAHPLIDSPIKASAVIRLLICLLVLSGCATKAPQIEDSLLRNALTGNVQAQYEIGMKYNKAGRAGWGKTEYVEEAARWFELAAGQGDARAQYQLSQYYFNARKDYNRSFALTQAAAQQGLADAQYYLGMHFAQAWGTEQNLVLAYKWIALANDGGIKGGRLADVEWLVWKGKMTADQIAKGQRLTEEHTRKYGKSTPIQLFR